MKQWTIKFYTTNILVQIDKRFVIKTSSLAILNEATNDIG